MFKRDNITYLVGNEKVSVCPFPPYDELLCEFLNDLSSQLRTQKETLAYPDIMTLAFWLRKANIAKLKAEFKEGMARLGVGLAFHITPSNVPVNFMFSFAFGLLSGNANIVRVPSMHFPQIDIISSGINRLFDSGRYDTIKDMTAFVRYEQNDEITGRFSADCNARIIWGGDVTVRNIRKLPIPERSVEVVFSDRYSFCVIGAPAVMKLDERGLARLAEKFYNDTYLMDQNACSSPHLIVWLGEEKEKAKKKFWEAVSDLASRKYKLAPKSAVDKYTLLCRDAISLPVAGRVNRYSGNVCCVGLTSMPDDTDSLRGSCGYFYEYDTEDINAIAYVINTKYQTLTYFGVDKSALRDFVIKNRLLGIDRIVPVGEALNIGVIWDGQDIIRSLSRIIDVK